MNIEWEVRENYEGSNTTTWFARIEVPSNIRRGNTDMTFVAGAVTQHEDGPYRTAFMRALTDHFDVPRTLLHTKQGAMRRVEKYLTLWAVAGYPTGE